MAKFKISYSFNGQGEAIIQAKNKEEASNKFDEGLWDIDEDKSHDYEIDKIEKIK
jgi:hypothetical protein